MSTILSLTVEESQRKKEMKRDTVFIAAMNEDLLYNILLRLPAKTFAYASCVNRFWNSVCNRILSRPRMISAFSRNPDKSRAAEEVLDKVLSEPIRPHFVIANITSGSMEETLSLIMERVGSRVPIIVSSAPGILGKEACSDKFGGVQRYITIDGDEIFGILLTIGYLPGMKVDIIPVIHAKGECEVTTGEKFVMDIMNYLSVVSNNAAPACLVLFGEDTHATEHIIQKLDYAMPAETIIVGNQKGYFLQKAANEPRHLQKEDRRVLAGLIFARDRHRPTQAGRIQFHTAISGGMSSIDLRYTAANVRVSYSRFPSTLLAAKRRGEAAVLNGEEILDDIEEKLRRGRISYSGRCWNKNRRLFPNLPP